MIYRTHQNSLTEYHHFLFFVAMHFCLNWQYNFRHNRRVLLKKISVNIFNISFQFDFLFNLDDDDQVVVSLAYTIPRGGKIRYGPSNTKISTNKWCQNSWLFHLFLFSKIFLLILELQLEKFNIRNTDQVIFDLYEWIDIIIQKFKENILVIIYIVGWDKILTSDLFIIFWNLLWS